LRHLLGIEHPIIVAPMFLVSNAQMIIAATESGCTGAIPALNYRTNEQLREAIRYIKSKTDKPFGINLIVNKSNRRYSEQLNLICREKVAFIITSLGSPKETIQWAHQAGIKVFCDVTDLHYAKKVEQLGCDALIAVNKEAGGHAGHLSYRELIPLLLQHCSVPIISAGGVGNEQQFQQMMQMGIAGVSIGSLFIASKEAQVAPEYKQACIDYGASDIVMTTKLSGTPCSVINTPYVQKIGTKQNFLERLLNRNKRLKRWIKMLVSVRGMKKLEQAAFQATYKTVWCAGTSIEYVKSIRPVKEILNEITGNKS